MISEFSAHLAPLSVDFRTWLWRYTYLLLLISMLWHRQAIFKSKGDKLSSSAEGRIWTRDPRHLIASRLNARWQTDWAIEDQAKKLELDSPSLWSASIQATWPHCQLTFAPGSGDIHICCCQLWCFGTGKRYSNRKETSCLPLLNAGFESGVPDTKSPADWMLVDKPTELSRIKLKNLNSTAGLMIRDTLEPDTVEPWSFTGMRKNDFHKVVIGQPANNKHSGDLWNELRKSESTRKHVPHTIVGLANNA